MTPAATASVATETKQSAKVVNLQSPLAAQVMGLIEEIQSFQKRIDGKSEQAKGINKDRKSLNYEQWLAGVQALSHIGYVKDKGYAIRTFKTELRDRKLPERTVKEIVELGRFVISKAKTWSDALTKDGAKVDPLAAFQKWPRTDLAKLLSDKGFDTLGKIRAAKYPKADFADGMMARLKDMAANKKVDDVLDLYAKFNAWMAENPNLANEADAESSDDE